MMNEKVVIGGVEAIRNTQKYFFLLAAEKLGLRSSVYAAFNDTKDMKGKKRILLKISNNEKSMLVLGATTSRTSYIGMKLAVDKRATNLLLLQEKIPTTEQVSILSKEDLQKALTSFGKIILKPLASRAGKGIVSNLHTLAEAHSAFIQIQKKFQRIIAERIVEGKEYRVLVVNFQVVAVAEYVPPFVVGDGTKSIAQLVRQENRKRRKQNETLIKMNKSLSLNLAAESLTLASVPSRNESIVLFRAAPISNGGYSVDVTEKIHPKNKEWAEKASRIVGLDVAGVDIITEDISLPLEETGGVIIEVNGGPDLEVHYSVKGGQSRNGAENILKDYFGLP